MDKAMRVLDAHAVEAGPAAPLPPAQKPPAERPLLHPDTPGGADDLGRAVDAAFLAEVLLHRRVETPFCLGLFGPPGAGKTSFLDQIAEAVDRLGRAAAGREGPFIANAVVVRVDAAASGDPGALLADAIFERLAVTHPALTAELAHAGADPAATAHQAAEALNDARRRHEAERQTLDELTTRDARLVEAVLETPGSSIDAYARSNRSPIERSLRQFGFSVADPVATYKQLAREAADAPGPGARVTLGLRALWAYEGQTRLLILAGVLALIAWAATALTVDQESWLAPLRGMGERAAPVADWAQAHVGWLGVINTVALVGCVLALATVVLRAVRFVRPIFRGAALLRQDLDGRRRDLKGLIAHQTRRVDGLAGEVEAAARRSSEAERRAGRQPAAGPDRPRLFPAAQRPEAASAAFFQTLASGMAAGDPSAGGPAAGAPGRILVAIDDLDRRGGAAAAAVLDAARRLFGPGLVCIAAGSRSHLVEGFSETDAGEALSRFERCIQIGYGIDAIGGGEAAWAAYAGLLAGLRPAFKARETETLSTDPARSALDRPWRPREAETLAALAVIAGQTPRAVKRFVNLYRVARADPALREAPAAVFTALAVALALDTHGLRGDLDVLARGGPDDASADSSVLRRALAVAREASGDPVDVGQAQRGLDVANRYATNG